MPSPFGTLELAELLQLLGKRPAEEEVRFDFGHLKPTRVGSYRGFYDHLALGWTDDYDRGINTVADLIKELQGASGRVYHGWKGGEYRMTMATPIWADNPGDASSTGIVGLCDCNYITILRTERLDV